MNDKQLKFFDGIKKFLYIPNQIDHIITKVRRVEEESLHPTPSLLPPPSFPASLPRNCFIMFPILYETVGRCMKIIKKKSTSCHINIISANGKLLKAYQFTAFTSIIFSGL